ncbi:hypothetical protein ACFYSJ_39485 [Streptomyces sp. NPDC005248]|uniref:hypothetical protein n=1 Tax=Streptomyces sp. NPDC005248 TaxID=3364709 RepID=UPI00369597CF
MHYYLSDNGQSLAVSGDLSVFTVPKGFKEVTFEEYAAFQTEHGTGDIQVELPVV